MKSMPIYIIALVFLLAAAIGCSLGGMEDVAISLGVATVPIAVIGAMVAIDEYLERVRPMGG